MLIVLAAFGASQALACSCVRSGTVDQEYAKSTNVVILKLLSLQKTESPPPQLINYGGIKQSTLTVEKVFKGTLKVGQELIFAQGGGADCVWTFDERSIGEEYLFYLGAKPLDNKSSNGVIAATGQFPKIVSKNVWIASTCSRSSHLKWAAADLLYLENMAKVAGRTRLSGRLSKRVESAVEAQPSSSEILPDRSVVITGNGKSIKLKTDKNGVYEIYDLPPGKYEVKPEPIEGFTFGWHTRPEDTEIEIKPKSHTEQDFNFRIDSAIRGKFFDANGKPLKDVCMKLLPAHGTKARDFFGTACSKADGSFQLDEIPTGSYVLLFNDDDKVTARTPFHAFYYPKTSQRENATEIQIAPGIKIENLIIVAPETVDVVTIRGTLHMQDGKPANGDVEDGDRASVEFVADGDKTVRRWEPTSRGDVDSQGRFTIRILKGQKGRLYGTILTFHGDYENCPTLEKIMPKDDKNKGANVFDINTQTVLIDGQTDQTGVELTFPFPGCKKAKIE